QAASSACDNQPQWLPGSHRRRGGGARMHGMHDAVSRPTPPAEPTAWPRRLTQPVRIGGVVVGGGKPVVVQSMTNTDTADVASSVKQVAELWRAGSEMVRLTVNTVAAAAAIPRIV